MKIIDVSAPYLYKNNYINGSVNIPYDELINNYRKYLNKNEQYYIYCPSGKLSKRAVMISSAHPLSPLPKLRSVKPMVSVTAKGRNKCSAIWNGFRFI